MGVEHQHLALLSVLCSTEQFETFDCPPRLDVFHVPQWGQIVHGYPLAKRSHRFAIAPKNRRLLVPRLLEGISHHAVELLFGLWVEQIGEITHLMP